MDLKRNPWEERFGWFWWNAPEIFRFTEEDFDQKAKSYAEADVTTVINFSCSHFRMAYYPYWDVLIDCISKIVKACHKYGIKVVEHHSSSLMHDLRWSKGWKRLENEFASYANHNSSLDDFPELVPHLIQDPIVCGKHALSFCQVDGRTGKIAHSNYGSFAMCFNNPDYFEAYLSHLDALIATGLDGIMNDDVQFFGEGHACTCEHCRKKFFETTGYTLPQPDEWDAFYGDYRNPVYLAWIKFRTESTGDFTRRIYDHYREVGFDNFYPNYVSGCLLHNRTFCNFDTVPEFWDFAFQENCEGSVQRCSVHYYMAEAVHRFALGQRKLIPSMSMFYPNSESDFYFAFAMARSWGQLLTATPEGKNMNEIERFYRAFETKNQHLFNDPKKLADVSVYFSRKTRDFVADAEALYMTPMFGLLHAAYAARLGVDMVFENDDLNTLKQRDTIVAGYIAMASDEELSLLRAYAEQGGKLLILGDCAIVNERSETRSASDVATMLGITADVSEYSTTGPVRISYCGEDLVLKAEKNRLSFSGNINAVATMDDGTCVGIAQRVGAGEIVWLPFDTNTCYAQGSVWGTRRGVAHPERVLCAPYHIDTLRETAGAMMKLVVGTPKLIAETQNDELMLTGFAVDGGYAIHLMNLEGCLPKEVCLVGFEDEIPCYMVGAEKHPALNVQFSLPVEVSSVTLNTPELEDGVILSFEKTETGISINVPGDVFSGYAVLDVKEK